MRRTLYCLVSTLILYFCVSTIKADTYEIRYIDFDIESPIAITDYQFERYWDYKTVIVAEENELIEQYYAMLKDVDGLCQDYSVDLRLKIIPRNTSKSTIYVGYNTVSWEGKKICQNDQLRQLIVDIIKKYDKDSNSIRQKCSINIYDVALGRGVMWRDIEIKNESFKNHYSGALIYGTIRAFYDNWNVPMGTFAKQLAYFFLIEDIRFNHTQVLPIIGWELMQGYIVPQDTVLGKKMLYNNEETLSIPDFTSNFYTPFWKTKDWQEKYLQMKYDSVDYKVKQSIIESQNEKQYNKLINLDVYGNEFMYAIYMIDRCNYTKAYYDLYSCLRKFYDTNEAEFGIYAKELSIKFLSMGANYGDTLCIRELREFDW